MESKKEVVEVDSIIGEGEIIDSDFIPISDFAIIQRKEKIENYKRRIDKIREDNIKRAEACDRQRRILQARDEFWSNTFALASFIILFIILGTVTTYWFAISVSILIGGVYAILSRMSGNG